MHPQTEIFRNEYCTIQSVPQLKTLICTAVSEYIPIENFKEIFQSAENFCDREEIKAFIFDKRNLRTFHQPSMEWYFTEWKPVMKTKGITIHYKILPDLEWFKQSVAAGRSEIKNLHGENFLKGITIKYIDGIEEAFTELKQQS